MISCSFETYLKIKRNKYGDSPLRFVTVRINCPIRISFSVLEYGILKR